MAFASTARALPNNPRSLGGFVDRYWAFTNASGDTGGTVTTGFAYIHKAYVEITSHVGAAAPKITISQTAGTVVLETGDNVDGNLIVTGRGVQ